MKISGSGARESFTGVILPFPLTRRVAYVKRHAGRMACLPPAAAERYLHRQLDIQRHALSRRGITETALEDEVKGLERAIRLAACHSSGPFDLPGDAK